MAWPRLLVTWIVPPDWTVIAERVFSLSIPRR